jgi:hypothetical protein
MDKREITKHLVPRIKETLEPEVRFVTLLIYDMGRTLYVNFWVSPVRIPLNLLIDTCMPTSSFVWLHKIPCSKTAFARLTADGLSDGLKHFRIGTMKRIRNRGKTCWYFTFQKKHCRR